MNKEVKVKAYEWVCPTCGKKIVSMYPRQFIQLVESHKLKHELKVMARESNDFEERELEES